MSSPEQESLNQSCSSGTRKQEKKASVPKPRNQPSTKPGNRPTSPPRHNHEDPLKLDTETYPESEAYGDVNLHLGWAVAQFYVQNYTNPEDKDGNMNNWWSEEDRAAFLGRNEKLVAYYNAMHPWEGQDFDGDNMKGEACADMAAVKCMLRIAAEKEDFDYDKFFESMKVFL